MEKKRCGVGLALLLLFCATSRAEDSSSGSISDFPSINYTQINGRNSTEYETKIEVDHGVFMKALYAFTNGFIDLIQSQEALPEGIFDKEEQNFEINRDAKKILKHYSVLIAISTILLTVAIILPCIGCCVYCCCNSQKDRHYSDVENLRCRKNMMGLTLLFVFVLLVFGIVFAILSNLAVYKGTNELPDHLDNVTRDLQLYSNSIIAEMKILLIQNFHELAEGLILILNRCSEWVFDKLMEWGPNIFDLFKKLDGMMHGLKNIDKNLGSIIEDIPRLIKEAVNLDNEFSDIKKGLIPLLKKTVGEESNRIIEEIENSNISIADKLEKLPVDEVKTSQSKIKQLLNNGIVNDVLKGKEELQKIKSEIQQKVNQSISEVEATVADIRENLTIVFENTTEKINETINKLVENNTKPVLETIRFHINKYSVYWYTFGLVICFTILVVSMLVLFGALCGLCDKKPDDYDKGCGPCFLVTAIWMIFCVISMLLILNVAQMLVGIMGERVICEPLKHPQDSRIIQLASKQISKSLIEGSFVPPNWTLYELIDSCHKNGALVRGFKLDELTVSDALKNYTNSFRINETIDDLVNGIHLNSSYQFMNQEAKEKLRELANSAVNKIDFDEIENMLTQNYTSFDLVGYSKKLQKLSDSLTDPETKSDLVKYTVKLENLQKKIGNLTVLSRSLGDNVKQLGEQIKFNDTSMQAAIENLIKDVEKVQEWINKNATTSIKEIATTLSTTLKNRINEFLTHVSSNIAENVGRCGPLSNLYNATIVASCDKILDPFNGFWLSLGWCLILFIPVLILSAKFIALLKRTDIESKIFFVDLRDYQQQATIAPNNLRGMKRSSSPLRRNYSGRASKSRY